MFAELDVPVTAVLKPQAAAQDPQLAHRQMTIEVVVPGGVMRVPRTPLDLGGVGWRGKAVRGPVLGEHNGEFGVS